MGIKFSQLKKLDVVEPHEPPFVHDWKSVGLPDAKDQDVYNIDNAIDEHGNPCRVYVSDSDNFRYKSTTTVLSGIDELRGDNKWLEAWKNRVGEEEADRISKQALRRGTATHDMAEKYLLNQPVKTNHARGYALFKELKPHLDKINHITCLEHALYSHKLKLAGRVDCVGEYEGCPMVIDFKTSRKPKERSDITSYFHQVTMYSMMYHETTGQQLDLAIILMGIDDMGNGKAGSRTFEIVLGDYRETVIDMLDWYWKEMGSNIDVDAAKRAFL